MSATFMDVLESTPEPGTSQFSALVVAWNVMIRSSTAFVRCGRHGSSRTEFDKKRAITG